MCGIVGEIVLHNLLVDMGLRGQKLLLGSQNRGHEAAGLTVSDGINVRTRKYRGQVIEAIPTYWATKRKGKLSCGHVRYSTTGTGVKHCDQKRVINPLLDYEDLEDLDAGLKNCQPFYTDSLLKGRIALVHNGNIVNAPIIKEKLQAKGIDFEAESDSEVIMMLIRYFADRKDQELIEAIRSTMNVLVGAYSCLLLTKQHLIPFRDYHGIRPLKLAQTEDSYIVSSEPYAWHTRRAKYVRNIMPGEIAEFDCHGKITTYPSPINCKRAFCIMEDDYLQSRGNEKVAAIRDLLGEKLFEEHSLPGIVIPVMESGFSAAVGYSNAQADAFPHFSKFYEALHRNNLVGRTFLEPLQDDREAINEVKFVPLFLALKRYIYQLASRLPANNPIWLIFIDDSQIRGTVAKVLIKRIIRPLLYQLLPQEIYQRVKIAWLLSSPPYLYPCFYGIDTPDPDKLIAVNRSLAQIQSEIGADYLGYLSLENLLSCSAKIHQLSTNDYCDACFSGIYPTPLLPELLKTPLEL